MGVRQPYLIVLSLCLLAAAPSRTQTYVAGQIIDPADVSENEDNLFAYLQAGVDTYLANSILSAAISDGAIVNVDVASSAAIALSKLASGTSGQLIVVNGSGVPTYVTLAGDATLVAAGTLTISSSAVGTSEVTDDTLTASDLAATLTFADGDFLNLASINASSLSTTLK